MSGQFIYKILLTSVFAFSAVIFASLFVVTAPYGRHIRKGWGLAIRSRVGWVVMEFPAFLIIILMFIAGGRQTDPAAIVFLAMWTAHLYPENFCIPVSDEGRK